MNGNSYVFFPSIKKFLYKNYLMVSQSLTYYFKSFLYNYYIKSSILEFGRSKKDYIIINYYIKNGGLENHG